MSEPGLAVTWWGHASTTVDFAIGGGVRVALDPLFVDRLAHLRRAAPTPPPAAAEADLVLVSHLHLDHCHGPSLARFDAGVPVIVPRGGEAFVAGSGLSVVPLAPGESVRVAGVEVEALPALHDGRRTPLSRSRPPALGFRLTAGGRSVWYPGDTGPQPAFAEVAPVDLALPPVGGWGPSLGPGHLDPQQAAAAVAAVGARWALPVHWGTFWPVGLRRLHPASHRELFLAPGERFVAAVAQGRDQLAAPTRVLRAAHGERVVLA
ncbi:MBL fold metallo-hydrolase [Nocardioides acrostichi]|uniref:MBL fold metallo-hydrolase n=1 Tax=Nocardioides acrostichi TaxID=2784339 RepID=A0A930Y6W7_9ACTN|nr:MBL fold metallo-hydrolase [Nocardioides acrostichi]MBF4161391.1 MBL fold metallo-hydrolase [Nocardioides acrostichi]